MTSQRLSLVRDGIGLFAKPHFDPHTWVLDTFKIGRGLSCAALLIPMGGCIEIQMVAASPTETAQRLIRRATAIGPPPSALITDMSEDWDALRRWLESCGMTWIGSQKELVRLERYAPAIFRASAALRDAGASASIRITC